LHSGSDSTQSILIVAVIMAVMFVGGLVMSRAAHGRNVAPSSILDRRPPIQSHLEQQVGEAFTLSSLERGVVGIHQEGNEVNFRASGNQWGVSISLSLGAGVAAIVVMAITDGWLWLLPVVGAVCLIAWTALLVRVSVGLTPDGVHIQGRLGRRAVYRWDQVESAQVEVQESGVIWFRGFERPTVAQGVISVGGRWLNLPGFRCPVWNTDKPDDVLNNTDLKVGIVIRYRASLVGPWPTAHP
jgi:hypothetical protein